jgi:hypothetical protein
MSDAQEQPTPGAGGAGDVGELTDAERQLIATLAVAARNAGLADHAGWLDRVQNTIRRIEADRDALRAAVEKYPRTADGELIIPGHSVIFYRFITGEVLGPHKVFCITYGERGNHAYALCHGCSAFPVRDCYSTREAARGPAAGETTDGGGKD